MAANHRAFLALLPLLSFLALGCEPVEETRKRERDAATPTDAGLVDMFCQDHGGDSGCTCFANTCDRDCGPGECQGVHIICPPGQDCLVTCDGPGACDGLVLECESGDADCAISCTNGACSRTRFRCNDAVGANCCVCVDSSDAFSCPAATGPTSCDPPS